MRDVDVTRMLKYLEKISKSLEKIANSYGTLKPVQMETWTGAEQEPIIDDKEDTQNVR